MSDSKNESESKNHQKKKKNSPYILYIYEHMKGMLNEIPGFYFCCFEVCWNKFSSMS